MLQAQHILYYSLFFKFPLTLLGQYCIFCYLDLLNFDKVPRLL